MEDICREVRRLCPEIDGEEVVAAFVARLGGVAGTADPAGMAATAGMGGMAGMGGTAGTAGTAGVARGAGGRSGNGAQGGHAASEDADRAASGPRPATEPGGASRRDESGPGAGITGSLRAALMFSKRHCGVPEWLALLALIEDFIATWDDPRMSPRRAADTIYSRDGWRCTAPGCSSRRNLQEHHIVYRSQRGSNASSNLVTLCAFHHLQGEHGGLMRCMGEAPLGITWWMGMGAAGGVFQNERRLDGRAQRPARLNLYA
jgi:hypothetical protein